MKKKKTSPLWLFVLWLSVLMLWASAASVFVSPAQWGGWWSLLGLAFPFFLAFLLLLALLTLLFSPRKILIPLVGLAGCCGTLRDYFPLNFPSSPPPGCLKVITYNTQGFSNRSMDSDSLQFETLHYLFSQQADIIGIQEAALGTTQDSIIAARSARKYGYHLRRMPQGGFLHMALAARFPIVRAEHICQSVANGAAAFYLERKPGDTLIVINCHLESMHLNPDDRAHFRSIVHNPQQVEETHGKLDLLRKIAHSAPARALQADTIAQFIQRHQDQKILLLGDFNNTPVSYTHHRICSLLTDTYRATGNGLGRSFHRDAIYVRIDNIFCSNHFRPFAAYVDPSVPFSDHYPLTVWLREAK